MSSYYSHSGPAFTEKHEKEEAEGLDDEEKEIILDDMYGRQEVTDDEEEDDDNNVDDDDDDDYDITDELIDEFNQILNETSDTEKKEYLKALENYESWPYIIDVESDPKRFLRAENYDVDMAVSRLLEYWKLRVEIFGDNAAAYKPITLDGALSQDDNLEVIKTILQNPTYMRTLPNDSHGRSVFCMDKTQFSYEGLSDQIVVVKIVWFAFHELLKKQSTQMKGMVGIAVEGLFDFKENMRTMKFLVRSFDEALPIKFKCVHVCSSSLFFQLCFPIIKFFMSRETRQRVQYHTSKSTTTVLNEFQLFGLYRCNLPISVGGTYKENPSWINDCARIAKAYQRKHRTKRQRSFY